MWPKSHWCLKWWQEADNRYSVARRTVALVVADEKTWVWEEFEDALVKNFQLALRRFWQTVWCLRKGNWVQSQAVLGLGGAL